MGKPFDLARISLERGFVTYQVNGLWVHVVLQRRVDDVSRNVERDRPRPACAGDMERLFDDARQFLNVLHQIVVLAD